MSLITVDSLTVQFDTDEGRITAVEDVSFAVAPGEILGLVGESGSGKSVTAKSLMRLNSDNARYAAQSRVVLHLDDRKVDVLSLRTGREMQIVRGGAISMIFQEPMASFAPAITIGDQMVEQLVLHRRISEKEAARVSIEMLERVGISDAAKRFGQYAFELSGGMRQRAMIAMALSTRPRLLIADEPTTALDVTIQAQVLDLMLELKQKVGAAILLITHDLGVVAEVAERIVVMYAGRKVEEARARDLFANPRHPYTQGLLGAVPKLGSSLEEKGRTRLSEIPGMVPNLKKPIEGCAFASRCPIATDLCRKVAPAVEAKALGHFVACHHAPREAIAA
ncbi:MAG: ABC transporter ATP-binding protein [Alphaproteobacteria bacterium]|nr:MAG: ABC transporter ATP-binding protein [Alphaproteobacteria bacterium]